MFRSEPRLQPPTLQHPCLFVTVYTPPSGLYRHRQSFPGAMAFRVVGMRVRGGIGKGEGSRLHLALPYTPSSPHCTPQHHKTSLSATAWLCWVPIPMSPVTALKPTSWGNRGCGSVMRFKAASPWGAISHMPVQTFSWHQPYPPTPNCCKFRESPPWQTDQHAGTGG